MPTSFSERYVRDRSKTLRVHANRLGKLLIVWSALEMDITLFLNQLASIKDTVTNNTLLGVTGMREKMQAVRALGYSKRPNDAWFDQLDTTLNEIDNDLRNERNRMVHDFWIKVPQDSTAKRSRFNPRVVNTQSRTKKLEFASFKPIAPNDISVLARRIEEASVEILELRRQLAPTPSLGAPPALPPPLSPTRGRS